VDSLLESRAAMHPVDAASVKALLGQTAVACARLAYQDYLQLRDSESFKGVGTKGGHPQRLLWASTGTKNSAYSDVKYVDSLIGPQTITTVPISTLRAYADHGAPAFRLEEDLTLAHRVMESLAALDINLEGVSKYLESAGLRKFVEPYDASIKEIEIKRRIKTQPITQDLNGYEFDRNASVPMTCGTAKER
jgi:transaldolase